MTKKKSDLTTTDLVVEISSNDDENEKRRLTSYAIKLIRKESGMERKQFCEWLKIPYRTMQEWELGRRKMPEYVLDLIEYKVRAEKEAGRI